MVDTLRISTLAADLIGEGNSPADVAQALANGAASVLIATGGLIMAHEIAEKFRQWADEIDAGSGHA